MIRTLVFPALVAVMEFCAAVMYASEGEWKAAGTWFFYSLAAGCLMWMK